MKITINKTLKIGLLSLLISGTAVADSALVPLGALQAGNNVSIQNELGTFPVSGSYTVLNGDQIKTSTGESTTLAVEGGHIYISHNSAATIHGANGNFTVELASGSIGYKLEGQSTVKISAAGTDITPVATDGAIAGAVAVGANEKLVVNPMTGNAVVVAQNGMATTIDQGNTWVNSEQGAKITLTQVEEEDDDDNLLWWILGGVAAAAIIIEVADDDDDDADTSGAGDTADSGGDESSSTSSSSGGGTRPTPPPPVSPS